MTEPLQSSARPDTSNAGGVWLKGDWHMHSHHSRDSSNNPPAKIIAFAERMGFDYLAITDHDVHVLGDVAAHTWADPGFKSDRLMLFYGAELTAARGHINIFSPEPYDHQRLFDARDARDWDLRDVKRALGVHMSANHPSTKNHYGFSFDLADSIEVWNTSVWPKNVPALRIWDDMLKSGRMLGARGGSDSHHGTPVGEEVETPLTIEASYNYVGTPTTWIYVRERSKSALLEALAAGRTSISANPFNPRVELHAFSGESRLMMGDNAPSDGRPVEFEISLAGTPMAGVQYRAHIIKNREPLCTVLTDPQTGLARFTDVPEAGARSYYRVEIYGPQTPYPKVPFSMAQSGDTVALSNPIYFNYDPQF